MCASLDESASAAGLFQTEPQIVDALRQAPDPILRNDKAAAADFRGEKVPQRTHAVFHDRFQLSFELPDTFGDFRFRLDHDLSGCAWRRSAKVRYKIRNREVHLVADRGDYRLL